MRIVLELIVLLGSVIALIGGIGLMRFKTTFARFHAAGVASPVAFMVTVIGAGPLLGVTGSAYLFVAALAMVLTLPVGAHLLFRAVHRTEGGDHLVADQLRQTHRRS